MTRIRVAIGDVQSPRLEDILVQITHQQPDMEFVGQVEKHNLKGSIARRKAEVLICEVGPFELPNVCRELFSEQNPPVVVGLARGGREATVCIANAGVAQLTSVIRSAFLSGGDSRNVIELIRPSEPQPDEEERFSLGRTARRRAASAAPAVGGTVTTKNCCQYGAT